MTYEEAYKTLLSKAVVFERARGKDVSDDIKRAIDALEKQIPKKPIIKKVRDEYLDEEFEEFYCCGCGARMYAPYVYCNFCGQNHYSEDSDDTERIKSLLGGFI